MNKNIMAVINPASSGGKTAKVWPKINKYFKDEFVNFTEKLTTKPGDAVKIAKEAVEKNYDYLLAVGGDGTVNELVNGMLLAETENLNTELIIYAQGTGSDLSRTLDISKDINEFIELIKREQSQKIKVIEAEFLNSEKKIENRYFFNAADCGMGAEVAKKLNENNKIISGSLNYLIKIFSVLFNYQNKEMKIEADNKLIYQGKINTAVIAHGRYFGGGIKIAPEADLYGSSLNLILLKDFSKLGIVLNLIKGYKGKHLSHPLVESYQAEEIKITTAEEVKLELDGESVGSCDASFKISDKEISVLV
jgi:YegS/Rv2252/BmrU family lipid kinase